jgi:hypothetical protein
MDVAIWELSSLLRFEHNWGLIKRNGSNFRSRLGNIKDQHLYLKITLALKLKNIISPIDRNAYSQ